MKQRGKKKKVEKFEHGSHETRRNETGVSEGQCQISDTVDNPVQTRHEDEDEEKEKENAQRKRAREKF